MIKCASTSRWLPISIMSMLLLLHFASGVALLLWAFNVRDLALIWWINTGVLVGILLSKGLRKHAFVLPALLSITIFVSLIIREIPIHSLPLHRVDQVRIFRLGGLILEIEDPDELKQIEAYIQRGRYRSIIKCMTGYELELARIDTHRTEYQRYYVLGDGLGTQPGGFSQSVFKPEKRGFHAFLEKLLAKHGHPSDQ